MLRRCRAAWDSRGKHTVYLARHFTRSGFDNAKEDRRFACPSGRAIVVVRCEEEPATGVASRSHRGGTHGRW
jgi:hypothetical protein